MSHFDFKIHFDDCQAFLRHWSEKYSYSDENLYKSNVGKPLNAQSIEELFTWKNGGPISQKKLRSIRSNYLPLHPVEARELEDRYLNPKMSGGAIWNIFFLHCIDPKKYAIFDQHTYRAMRYIQSREIQELPTSKARIYQIYRDEYQVFVKELAAQDLRTVDKAFFAFGQFLKLARPYI